MEINGNKRNFGIMAIAIFAAYTFFGFADSARGPAMPRIQADFQVSELHIGLLLTTNTIGYVLACSYTAALAKKIGMKTCLVIALFITVAAGILICFSPDFIMLAASFFIMNLGFGMLELSLGVIAATIFTKNTGAMMNLAQFFYGAGSVFSPVVSTGLMAARLGGQILSWRYMYLIILSFALIPAVPALIGRFVNKDNDKKKAGFKSLLKSRALRLIIVMLSFSAVCEIGCVAWLVNFLEKAYSFSGEKASMQLTLFFLCFTATRLIVCPVIDKIGLINALAILTAITGTVITIGIMCGATAYPLLAIAGIGVGPVFPTVYAVTAKLFSEEIDKAITAINAIMGIVIIPSNLVIGGIINKAHELLSKSHGDEAVRLAYSVGFLFLALCGFVAFIFALLLRRNQKKAGLMV